jgi:hypothetical protein
MMKNLLIGTITAVTLLAGIIAQAAESAAPAIRYSWEKRWYVGLGPVVSNSLPGTDSQTAAGTKFDINLGYLQPLSEKLDLLYFWDGNFNSSTMGNRDVIWAGAGLFLNTLDRGSDYSPVVKLALGYGGGNRGSTFGANPGGIDHSPCASVGLGFRFFRTQEFSFEVMFEHMRVLTKNVTRLESYPEFNQVRFGVYF